MKRFLMAAVVAIVTVSMTDSVVCQIDQYSSQQRYPADRMASRPATPNSARYRGRDWRPRFARTPAVSVAQNYSDATQWNTQTLPAPYSGTPDANAGMVPQNPVPQTEYYPEMNSRSVVTREPMSTRMPLQESSYFQDAGGYGGGSKAFSEPWHAAGYTPFLNGNIFGAGKDECCDEWANHCPCLELTNHRSNCDCANPNRSNSEPCRDGYRPNRTDCQGCNRSASRSSVSEYFHPDQYRR